MEFSLWKLLNESISAKYLSDEAKKVKDIVSDKFKSLYVIPDFETFKRPGEPEQHSNLFTDQDLNTFAINYTTNGTVFSVDVWKNNETKPFVTYYVGKGRVEDIAKTIPEIIQNPEKKVDLKTRLKKSYVNEAESLEMEPSTPKPAMPIDKDKKADDDYDYSDPETVFEDLKTYIDMIIKGTQPSLLITGSPGVGKTYLVTKQLSDAGLKSGEDFIHVKGRSTAAGMFVTLYENNGKIIVFDDCDSVFGNPDGVNILKGALDSYGERQISWLVGKPLKATDGSVVPKSFVFTGRVIFISNLPQRKIDDAIKSRSFVIEVALTPDDMLKKMRNELPNVHPEIPLSLREDALDFIENVYKKAKHLELNMRTLVKAIKIIKEVPNLKIAERLILQQCSYK